MMLKRPLSISGMSNYRAEKINQIKKNQDNSVNRSVSK